MLSLSDIYGSRIARAYKCIREHLECIAASVARKLTWYRCRCPDVAKVKPKMIYASSKEELKKRLVGLACEPLGATERCVGAGDGRGGGGGGAAGARVGQSRRACGLRVVG